jgi:hypothetical protein
VGEVRWGNLGLPHFPFTVNLQRTFLPSWISTTGCNYGPRYHSRLHGPQQLSCIVNVAYEKQWPVSLPNA